MQNIQDVALWYKLKQKTNDLHTLAVGSGIADSTEAKKRALLNLGNPTLEAARSCLQLAIFGLLKA